MRLGDIVRGFWHIWSKPDSGLDGDLVEQTLTLAHRVNSLLAHFGSEDLPVLLLLLILVSVAV